MKFLEKDLEEIIFNADKDSLSERGLYIEGKLKKQLRIGNYGIADLVGFQRPYYHPFFNKMMKGVVTVYELKKDNISISAFFQAVRYLKGIIRYLESRGIDFEEWYNTEIVLIGKNLPSGSDLIYLPDLIQSNVREDLLSCSDFKINVEMFTYSYDIKGIQFKQISDYRLTDEGFKLKNEAEWYQG